MEDVERDGVDAPIVLIERSRTDVSSLDQGILPWKMKDVKMNRMSLAKDKALDNVQLNGRFGGTFLPKRDKILGICIPDHGGRGRNTGRKKGFLQSEKLSMAGRQSHL